MKIALIVGVDYYENIPPLYGCVNDAYSVNAVLNRNGDGSVNFDCNLLTASNDHDKISRGELIDAVTQLFNTDANTALFYFAGHGYIKETGGYLISSECKRGDDGVSLSELLDMANSSPATNKIIMLDSCHSGLAGSPASRPQLATITEGVTILTASTKDQYASEEDGHGVFTHLLVDALSGSAANLTGDITPGSVYAHIDQSLGAWEQRPVFKTNVKQFVSMRKVNPSIALEDLRRIPALFPSPGYEYPLDPSYEPETKGRDKGMPPPNAKNTQIFALLQKYNRLNLLIPMGAPHMWHAAMESKTCKLTALGEHYRRLALKNRI